MLEHHADAEVAGGGGIGYDDCLPFQLIDPDSDAARHKSS